MCPDLYFEDAAGRGNRVAAEMLHALRHIQTMLAPAKNSFCLNVSARTLCAQL
jgi:hypothetical protein